MSRGCGYDGRPPLGCGLLLPEPVELVLGQAALEERAGVDAGGGVALEIDLVAAARVVLAAEEVVEADLVERRRRGVRRDVAADADAGPLRPVHHDRGVPADPRPVAALDLLVAGEPRLGLGRDGVDVVGRRQARDADAALAGPLEQREHEVARARAAALVDRAVEGLQPLAGLLGVDVGQLAGQAVEDGPGVLACDHCSIPSSIPSSCRSCAPILLGGRATSHLARARRGTMPLHAGHRGRTVALGARRAVD